VSVEGGKLDEDALLRETHIAVGGEVTALTIPQMSARTRAFYAQHGYEQATVDIDVRETDDPAKVALVVRIKPGSPSTVTRRVFVRDGTASRTRSRARRRALEPERSYSVGEGDVVDDESLATADRAGRPSLERRHYHRARFSISSRRAR
jgi:outer membrane protein assembly factor BamA